MKKTTSHGLTASQMNPTTTHFPSRKVLHFCLVIMTTSMGWGVIDILAPHYTTTQHCPVLREHFIHSRVVYLSLWFCSNQLQFDMSWELITMLIYPRKMASIYLSLFLDFHYWTRRKLYKWDKYNNFIWQEGFKKYILVSLDFVYLFT